MDERDLERTYAYINSVKDGLKQKNRFSCDPAFDELLHFYAKEQSNTGYIYGNTFLFRARIYKRNDAQHRYNYPPEGDFKGYDETDSFVNKDNKSVTEGRCNPSYIPYLYTASTEKCCIYEVRPTKESYVSVAKIRVGQKLKILRFDKGGNSADTGFCIIPGMDNAALCLYLSLEFSRPHKEYGDYLLCQYVSEKVKNMGFDGLSYASAICPKNPREDSCFETIKKRSNANIIIFNYDKCRAISSRLVFVDDVTISYV